MNRWGQARDWRRIQLPFSSDTMVSWLLSILLALGPIYWLPGISEDVLNPFKWGILAVALGLVFGTELVKRRRPFPGGLLGPLGFAGLLLLWIPGLAQASEPVGALLFVVKLGLSAAFFWCFFCLARRDWDGVIAIFRRAFLILIPLIAAALAVALAGTVDWRSPCGWEPSYIYGLGLRPTGWAIGLGLLLPVAALLFLTASRRWPLAWKSLAVFSALVLIASQVVAGGRAGLLVSLICIAAFALFRSSRWLAFTVVLVGDLVSVPYWDESCNAHLRLNLVPPAAKHSVGIKDPAHKRPSTPVDEVTSHRTWGYRLALDKIRERPFLGHGLRQVVVLNPQNHRQTEIHNLWLKWSAYTGIAAPLLLLVMVALILYAAWRVCRDPRLPAAERDTATVLGLVFFIGLVVSMLEIDVPVGVFHRSAIWWAAAGALIGAASRMPQPRPPWFRLGRSWRMARASREASSV